MSDIKYVFDKAAMELLFASPAGPMGKVLIRVGHRVTNKAKRLCPVDTGNLRSSINNELRSENGHLVVRVGTNVAYAPYVEFGTRRMRAQPFLRPALDSVLNV